eukprot:c20417_g1_i1.p2 GENE.c20417_g1_i1~~c20417_g1_i1.p2  ORF type:complete len:234 (-),score=48.58 c20417_g1_i1:90-791(-)
MESALTLFVTVTTNTQGSTAQRMHVHTNAIAEASAIMEFAIVPLVGLERLAKMQPVQMIVLNKAFVFTAGVLVFLGGRERIVTPTFISLFAPTTVLLMVVAATIPVCAREVGLELTAQKNSKLRAQKTARTMASAKKVHASATLGLQVITVQFRLANLLVFMATVFMANVSVILDGLAQIVQSLDASTTALFRMACAITLHTNVSARLDTRETHAAKPLVTTLVLMGLVILTR